MSHRDIITVPVDVYYPHRFARDNQVVEHKCHKIERIPFPSTTFLFADNSKLLNHVAEYLTNNRPELILKLSVLYTDSGSPEKIVLVLKQWLPLVTMEEILKVPEVPEKEQP